MHMQRNGKTLRVSPVGVQWGLKFWRLSIVCSWGVENIAFRSNEPENVSNSEVGFEVGALGVLSVHCT